MALPRTLLAASVAAGLVACDTPVETGANACTVDAEGGRVLDMAVGEVLGISDPSELACLRIEAAAAPSRYLFIPANATERQDVRIPFTIKTSAGEAPAAASVSAALEASVAATPERRPMPLRATHIDERIRRFEQTLDPNLGLARKRALRESRTGVRSSVSKVITQPPTVGMTDTIRVPNFDDNTASLCDNPIKIGVTVKAVGENSVIILDDESPANGLSDADFASIAAEFDTLIYPVDTTYFGVPSDLDVDGRIYILYTPEVNKLSEPNSGSYVGGFFFSGDLFEAVDCEQSNEREIFYLLAADPTGEFGNDFGTDLIKVSTRGTIAHEFQHMINLGVKIAAPFLAYDETAWLNEGLSHFAEELVGREVLDHGPLDELTWAETWEREDVFIAYFYQNYARFEPYLKNPAGSSPTSNNADNGLSYRGAAWAFVRHLSDHYSNGNVASFTRSLVLSPDTGIANVESRTATDFSELIEGWLVANWADDRGITNLDPRYEYRSWKMREAMACFAGTNSITCNGSYPLKVTALDAVPTTGTSLSILSGSGAYFLGNYGTTTPSVVVQMRTNTGQPLTAEGARMYVLRAQ